MPFYTYKNMYLKIKGIRKPVVGNEENLVLTGGGPENETKSARKAMIKHTRIANMRAKGGR